MKKNILYVGDNPSQITNGGDWINKRNILALKEIFQERLHLYPVKCKNMLSTFINLLRCYMFGLSPVIVARIISYVKENNIDCVFLSSSRFGKLAYKLKLIYPDISIYVFFHNIEKQYTSEEYRVNRNWKNWLIAKVTAYNENNSCRLADKLIVLNQRDNKLLQTLYSRKADILLPTTFIDRFDIRKKQQKGMNEKFTLLFVGFAFFANIEGLRWFIDEVLPHLNGCRLQIVGSGMDKVFTNGDNIEVHGYVDDLGEYYYQADAVVLPILSGGGMKTKTAEALMYGCPIIGTKEAFEGYELDYDKVGGWADSKEDMIRIINSLVVNPEKVHQAGDYARNVFERNYSFNNTVVKLKELDR